ncbi:peroxiredoxin-like family protein [Psychroserpens sp. NJDZ02]|uniref:peroxiredoxin-like family protein n=1 Tax=Psychroserpens sp. NJDZ02 TaxID=2570561 RepID=UPI0010A7A5BE|nr:peroxiredoxin-like family protein [Psychroserpens sp. NJDZ02]QCE42559.1 AhpC/TSA family protein [Psychroserpens sp. NJDZ02]
MDNNKNTGELDVLLDKVRQAGAAKFSDEKKQIYADGIASVAKSGVLENALNVGDKALNFTLKNALNKSVNLYDELKNGPVVLTWYRGGWCPYCNITLHALQDKLPEFKNEGATLLALTPELPDNSLSTSEKNNLEFSVLSDLENTVGKEYGVVYTLTDDVATIYNAGFGLNKVNGDNSNQLPLAATYVIDTNGIIQYAFLDADYTKRAEVTDILTALRKLS